MRRTLAALALCLALAALIPAAARGGERPWYAWWPPVPGARVSSPFGERADPFGGGGTAFHAGVDFAAPAGMPVYAAAAGIAKVGYDEEGWGVFVIVRDREREYHYYHLSEAAVRTGDRVEAGQVIGYVGSTGASTGPHLHFAVKANLDPLSLL